MLSLKAASRCSVGPVASTNTSSAMARHRLISLSSFTPLPTPEMAEVTASAMTTAMTTMRRVKVFSLIQPSCSRPAPIWVAPKPSVVMMPNSVASSAMMSMASPRRPLMRSLKRG